jgi:two-component system sporulation sensor kinase B
MMIVVLVLQWVLLAVIILFNKIENKLSYWYTGLIFFLSLGVLCEIIRAYIVPITAYRESFELLARFLSALSYRFSPYFAMLTAIEMYYKGKNKTKINMLLLIPIVMGFIFDFAYPETGFIKVFLDWSPFFWATAIWGVPYFLIANGLMLVSYYKEQSQWVKQQKLLSCILIMPIRILMVNTFLLPLFFKIYTVNLNVVVEGIICLIFVVFAVKYGIMGLKISLEKQKMDVSVQALSTGTMILSHALKNEITNIAMNIECIDGNEDEINSIKKSSARMLKMIKNINTELEDIKIEKAPGSLNEMLEGILETLNINSDKIRVIKKLQDNLIVKYDHIYFKDALVNVIKNALEAMSAGGIIEISTQTMGKHILIRIKDTGNGISEENLSHVMEPYFSTKKNFDKNYGLGLTSSYRIVRLHSGSLEIISKVNEGTVVLIQIPR